VVTSVEPEWTTTVKFVPQVTDSGIKPDLDENSETNLKHYQLKAPWGIFWSTCTWHSFSHDLLTEV
jgi:hypothetical protein